MSNLGPRDCGGEIEGCRHRRLGHHGAAPQDRLQGEGIGCIAIEDGFIRSAGLGAAFVQPLSLVFDRSGLYYDPTRPSDIETMLARDEIGTSERARAEALRENIVAQV